MLVTYWTYIRGLCVLIVKYVTVLQTGWHLSKYPLLSDMLVTCTGSHHNQIFAQSLQQLCSTDVVVWCIQYLYCSLIREQYRKAAPCICYLQALLTGHPKSSLKSLQRIQNAVERELTGTRKRDHISLLLASLHWLLVKVGIEFKILLLTYKVLNHRVSCLITLYYHKRALCSQGASLLSFCEALKSRMGGSVFTCETPLLYNQLPL